MVPVLADAKKMTVGRRKRKRVGGCEKEDGAVGRRKRKGGGGVEGGRYIGRHSCPAKCDMYSTSKL